MVNVDWEALWAPYDEMTYHQALAWVGPDDVVLDIGAGDLRLARRMAQVCRKVYALEYQDALLSQALQQGPLPDNLIWLHGDARTLAFPDDVTVGVLLMRHCTHTALYIKKLQALGARGLITNARWHLDVEWIDLQAPRLPFEHVHLGWYACACGQVGFVPGPPEALTDQVLQTIHEVAYCPACNQAVNERLPCFWNTNALECW